MKTLSIRLALVAAAACMVVAIGDAPASDMTKGFKTGTPEIGAMSALEFGPQGLLFIGDSRSGAVFVVDTGDRTTNDPSDRFSVNDIEGKVAAMQSRRTIRRDYADTRAIKSVF